MPRSLSSLGGSFEKSGSYKQFIEPGFLVDKPFNITSAEVVTVNFDGEDKEVIHFHITLLPYDTTGMDEVTPVKPGQYILTLGVNPARMEVVDYFTGPEGTPVASEPIGPVTLVRGKKRVKGNFPFIFSEYFGSDVS